MDIMSFFIMNFFNGLIGVFGLLIGFLLFDMCTPNGDFEKAFAEKGISGGAIVVASYILGLALIIAWAVF